MAPGNRTSHITAPDLFPPDPSQVASPGVAGQGGLSRAEIAARCECAHTASERRRWQVIGLLADQAPLSEIVAATGCRPRTIRQIAQRYRAGGPAALVDGRRRSVGARPILSAEQQHELGRALLGAPPDGGVWNGPKVAQWIAARTGRAVHRQRGWEYLRRFGGASPQAECAPDGAEQSD